MSSIEFNKQGSSKLERLNKCPTAQFQHLRKSYSFWTVFLGASKMDSSCLKGTYGADNSVKQGAPPFLRYGTSVEWKLRLMFSSPFVTHKLTSSWGKALTEFQFKQVHKQTERHKTRKIPFIPMVIGHQFNQRNRLRIKTKRGSIDELGESRVSELLNYLVIEHPWDVFELIPQRKTRSGKRQARH